ncbi:hypothetical protein Taro_049670 [Colocasia esculenta]|uniref:Uncharacterized protein n=1 Tax=Colocasia esculenta TaxID=4460 RepID=A0A843XBP0_COLES|nr:hypothetical protein [Colocasia esculenta]
MPRRNLGKANKANLRKKKYESGSRSKARKGKPSRLSTKVWLLDKAKTKKASLSGRSLHQILKNATNAKLKNKRPNEIPRKAKKASLESKGEEQSQRDMPHRSNDKSLSQVSKTNLTG